MGEKIAYVVDFDGTVTAGDISTELAHHFGGEAYWKIEQAYRQRQLGMRDWLEYASALLPADLGRLLDFALERAVLRSGFKEFAQFARDRGRPLAIASDGFGFYIEPILEQSGCLEYIDAIYKNEAVAGENGSLRILNTHAHAACPVCGNCKATHVLKLKREGLRVAYAGDGSNDRFGASWSDYVFARERLADYYRDYGLPFRHWDDFHAIIEADLRDFPESTVPSPFCRPEGEGYLL